MVQDLKKHIEGVLEIKAGKPLNSSGENSFIFYLLENVFERGYDSVASFFQQNSFELAEDSAGDRSSSGKVIFTATKGEKSHTVILKCKRYSFTVTVIL